MACNVKARDASRQRQPIVNASTEGKKAEWSWTHLEHEPPHPEEATAVLPHHRALGQAIWQKLCRQTDRASPSQKVERAGDESSSVLALAVPKISGYGIGPICVTRANLGFCNGPPLHVFDAV